MTFALILCGLIVVLLTGVPVFAGLLLFSVAILYGVEGHLGGIGDLVFGKLDTYLLVAIPLFTLMAHFMIRGKVVDDLFGAAHVLLRHLPGGLGVATVAACTVFAAISGSSVAIPLMIRYGYSPRFAYGVVGGGGTLGILIPPSGPMVLFGVVSDTSIGALFIAGIVPGLMLAVIFAIYCMTAAKFGTRKIATEPRASAKEVVTALRRSFWALTLPAFVLGGMYFGVFTATEAAAIDAARNSAMLFLILAAAAVLGHVLTKLRIPNQMVELVTQYGVSQLGFLLALMLLIFVLGMFLETISIILITTPVVLPVLAALKIHPVWYGILLTINLELALITPPVGMNLFALKAITRAPLADIIAGVTPYVGLLILGLALVLVFPSIALWLPATMQFR